VAAIKHNAHSLNEQLGGYYEAPIVTHVTALKEAYRQIGILFTTNT
jgi:hypothetical protein